MFGAPESNNPDRDCRLLSLTVGPTWHSYFFHFFYLHHDGVGFFFPETRHSTATDEAALRLGQAGVPLPHLLSLWLCLHLDLHSTRDSVWRPASATSMSGGVPSALRHSAMSYPFRFLQPAKVKRNSSSISQLSHVRDRRSGEFLFSSCSGSPATS